MATDQNTAPLDRVRTALAAYDERVATCPLNSKNAMVRHSARDICPACKAPPTESCRRDNPWPVVEAVRQALAPATGGGE